MGTSSVVRNIIKFHPSPEIWGGYLLQRRDMSIKKYEDRLSNLKVAISERKEYLLKLKNDCIQTESDIEALYGAIQECTYWKDLEKDHDVAISDKNISLDTIKNAIIKKQQGEKENVGK
jgi:hypothetical protein